MEYAAGQRWTYRTPEGFEASRIVIGAVVSFGENDRVVCAAVAGAPTRLPDGSVEPATIPFLPFCEPAFAATVVEADGHDVPPPEFTPALEAWMADPRGLSTFTVAFDGSLGRLIAAQMAQIAAGTPVEPTGAG